MSGPRSGIRPVRAAREIERLTAWLPISFIAFFAAAFVLPAGPDYALLFYVAVIPCTLAALASGRRPHWDAAFGLAVGLVAWSGATLLWGHDDGHRSLAFARDTFCTLIYAIAAALVLVAPEMRATLRQLLIVIGAGNALLSIAIGLIAYPDVARLVGWGVTRHPILGAASMAVPYLLALHGALARGSTARIRWINFAAAAVMVTFILFTDSRGPLLAAATATLFLCVAGPWRRFAVPGFALALAIWWAPSVPVSALMPTAAPSVEPAEPSQPLVVKPPPRMKPRGAEEFGRRGTSHRLEIWAESFRLIHDRPMFGHGLADNLHLDVGGGEIVTFPHDLYLSLLFYSGAVGLTLFAAMMFALALRLWRGRDGPECPWLAALLVNALCAGLTDLGQITKGPGPIWVIVWLPTLLAMTAPLSSADARQSPA